MFKTTRKSRRKSFFFTRKFGFFSKICSQQPLMILKNWSYYFRSICQNTSSNLINCCLRLVILDNTRKKAKIFSYWKDCFFSKICVFQQLLRCYRIDLTTSTVNVGLPFGPLPIAFWGLSHSIIREKTGQSFVSGHKAFFEKFGSQILRS